MPIELSNSTTTRSGAQLTLLQRSSLAMLPPNVPITGLEIDKLEAGAVANAGTFRIYLGNTTATTVTAGTTLAAAKAGLTLVYSSTTQAVPDASGWWAPGSFNGDAFTYTGDGMFVLTEFDATALGANPVTGNTRLRFGCTDLMASGTVLQAKAETAVSDSTTLASDVRMPNLRFTFTPPSAPFLVVESGRTPLTTGGSYTPQYGFADDVTVPQRFRLRNSGGMPITFGAASFDDLLNLPAPAITEALPVMLAPGASAPFVFTVTPTTATNVRYRATIGSDSTGQPFVFTVNSIAGLAAAPAIKLSFVDEAGRVDGKESPSVRNVPIGQAIPFQIMVSNYGSGPLNLTGSPVVTKETETNATGSCTPPAVSTVAPQEDLLIDCTRTTLSAGFSRFSVSIAHNDPVWGGPLFVIVDANGETSLGTPSLPLDMAAPSTDMAGPSETNSDLAVSPDLVAATGEPNLQLWYTYPSEQGEYQLGDTLMVDTALTVDGQGVTHEFVKRTPITIVMRNKGTAPLVINTFTASGGAMATMDSQFALPITVPPEGEVYGYGAMPEIFRPAKFVFEIKSNDPDTPTRQFTADFPGTGAGKKKNCSTVGGPLTLDDVAIVMAMVLATFVGSRRRRYA